MHALIRYRHISRRGATALIALLALACAQAESVASPPGPRLATIEFVKRGPTNVRSGSERFLSLSLVDPASGREQRLLRGTLRAKGRIVPSPFSAPAWTADGSRIVVLAFDGGGERGRFYRVAADGSGPQPIPGTRNASNPVISPDGRTLAFARTRSWTRTPKGWLDDPVKNLPKFRYYSSTSTWIVDLAGGKARRLTPWQNGLSNKPTSFSPDGSQLLLARSDRHPDSPRVMAMNVADGQARQLIGGAGEAVYSPDGTRIAFTGYLHPDVVETSEESYLAEELYLANADGSGIKRLSRSDDVIESAPSWDPSGQRLAYVQVRADTSFVPSLGLLFPMGNALMQVNPDGTCRKKLLSRPTIAFYGAAWQPGPGREAGPLSC